MNRKKVRMTHQIGVGKILISKKITDDYLFKESVVLLTDYDIEGGAMGFILNKPSEVPYPWEDQGFLDPNIPTYDGGPQRMEDLFFLHTLGNRLNGSKKIAEGVYLGDDYEQLRDMLNNKEVNAREFRFFTGFCFWPFYELVDEINKDEWVLYPIQNKKKFIFHNKSEEMWKKAYQKMGFRFFSDFSEENITLN